MKKIYTVCSAALVILFMSSCGNNRTAKGEARVVGVDAVARSVDVESVRRMCENIPSPVYSMEVEVDMDVPGRFLGVKRFRLIYTVSVRTSIDVKGIKLNVRDRNVDVTIPKLSISSIDVGDPLIKENNRLEKLWNETDESIKNRAAELCRESVLDILKGNPDKMEGLQLVIKSVVQSYIDGANEGLDHKYLAKYNLE